MRPGVVGRESELADAEQFLDAAGRAFAVLVLEGEPGIGKTTIWREARRRAQESGTQVLSCRPAAAEAKFSFAGVADLLSSLDEAAFAALPESQHDALQIALLHSSPKARSSFSRATAAGFLTLIRNLTTAQRVLLAVDDWQWLDLPSRRVLEFVARRLEDEPVGLLCSIRSPVTSPLFDGVVDEQRRQTIALGPLSLAAAGRIVHERLGRPLPRPLLVRILQASGGNPFYALEVARLVTERDLPKRGGADLPVPDDLRRLTADRIRRLPANTQDALLLAAVLAKPDGRSVDLDALASAEEAGIVTIDNAGRIEFAHPLLAFAAYGSVPAPGRQALHRRAAELVSDPELRARHLALSTTEADAPIAEQLDEAAARAASRGAPDAAAELAELAAERTPLAGVDSRGERLLAAAHFHFDAGDLVRAETLTQAMVDGSMPDPLRARALRLAAHIGGRRNNYTQSIELASEALELAGEDPGLRADIELELAYSMAGLGDLFGGGEHFRAAAAHARAAGDKAALAAALGCLAMLGFICGRGRNEDQVAQVLALGDPVEVPLVVRPRYLDGVMRLWMGDLGGSLERLGKLHDEAVERGQEADVPMLMLYMSQAYVWKGDLVEAGRLADEAQEVASVLDDPTAAAVASGAAALVHALDGRSEVARSQATEALSLFEALQWRAGAIWPLWALGLLELSEGNPAAVDRVLGSLSEQVAAMGMGDPSFLVFLPDEIQALIELGELDRAQRLLEPFERSARELERHWAMAIADRCRGALHAARGESEQSFLAFEWALAAHDLAGMPFERARTLLSAGQAYRRFKQRRRAREALEEALAVFEDLGAPLWADRARAELARVGHRGAGGDELTETERRVAELAASGLSNQEIAEYAFLSVKTVEANLTRVYRKLGVRSRVKLANSLRIHA